MESLLTNKIIFNFLTIYPTYIKLPYLELYEIIKELGNSVVPDYV